MFSFSSIYSRVHMYIFYHPVICLESVLDDTGDPHPLRASVAAGGGLLVDAVEDIFLRAVTIHSGDGPVVRAAAESVQEVVFVVSPKNTSDKTTQPLPALLGKVSPACLADPA